MYPKIHDLAVPGTIIGLAIGLAACADSPVAPAGVPFPHEAPAALQAEATAFTSFTNVYGDFVLSTGLLTDELTARSRSNSRGVDMRTLGTPDDDPTYLYPTIQDARMEADVAARALALYAPGAPTVHRARAFAVQGYAEIMLADLFCSRIPMSQYDLDNGHAVQKDAWTRDSVYRHAVALFDSALALAADNDSLTALARVGKGRALLALGDFTAAAQAVSAVPDGAQYRVGTVFRAEGLNISAMGTPDVFGVDYVSDREGSVGLAYRSSLDPRTWSVVGPSVNIPYVPNKYVSGAPAPDFTVSVIVADWVEARLIQAEAALHANDVATWLQILNHLRATVPVPPPASDDGVTPIVLTPLTDPGTSAARLDTMFAERAKWLYLTGHRQGDLRRLIRQYGRTQQQVYPTGAYANGGTYGSSVAMLIPSTDPRNPKPAAGCSDQEP